MWQQVLASSAISGVSNISNQRERMRQEKQHNKNVDRMIDSNSIEKAINRQNAQANEAWANKMIKKYGGDRNRTEAIAESYTGKTRALGENSARLSSQQHQLLAQKVDRPGFNWGSLLGEVYLGGMQSHQIGQNTKASKDLSTDYKELVKQSKDSNEALSKALNDLVINLSNKFPT
jgi:hypothetical protein